MYPRTYKSWEHILYHRHVSSEGFQSFCFPPPVPSGSPSVSTPFVNALVICFLSYTHYCSTLKAAAAPSPSPVRPHFYPFLHGKTPPPILHSSPHFLNYLLSLSDHYLPSALPTLPTNGVLCLYSCHSQNSSLIPANAFLEFCSVFLPALFSLICTVFSLRLPQFRPTGHKRLS